MPDSFRTTELAEAELLEAVATPLVLPVLLVPLVFSLRPPSSEVSEDDDDTLAAEDDSSSIAEPVFVNIPDEDEPAGMNCCCG